jgi:hypothetical protein
MAICAWHFPEWATESGARCLKDRTACAESAIMIFHFAIAQ